MVLRPGLSLRDRLRHIPITTILFLVLWLVFIAFAGFFAFKLRRGIMPDEGTHSILSYIFSGTWGIPADSADTFRFGPVNHKPFLFYWINGRLINLLQVVFGDPGSWRILVTLRLASVFYSVLAVLYTYLLAREVIRGRWWQLLPVFLLTNTLMFVFLSGGANYDNLSNLACFAGIYHLIRVFNGKPFWSNSLAWLIWMLVGTLVKLTVLPVLAVTGILWFFYLWRNRRQLNLRPALNWKLIALLALFGIVTLMNAAVYGVNLVKYQTINPSCPQLLTEEQCMESAVYQRDSSVYLPERLTLTDMLKDQDSVPDPYAWFRDFWSGTMLKMTYGIQGHRSYTQPEPLISAYRIWWIGLLLIAVRYWKVPRFTIIALAIIAVFYTAVLLRTNLNAELGSGFKHLGIQGRYIFPVIGILYVLAAALLERIPNRGISYAVAALTFVLFLWGSPAKTILYQSSVTYTESPNASERQNIPLSSETEVAQDFVSQCQGTLSEISILAAEKEQPAQIPVTLRLTDLASQQVIAEQTARVNITNNEAWLVFPIGPVRDSEDRSYRVSLAAPEASREMVNLSSSAGDAYLDGSALIGGIPTSSDLIFRYRCNQSALAEWFY